MLQNLQAISTIDIFGRLLVYGSAFIGVSSFSVANGVATIITEEAHGFRQSDYVKVTFTNPSVDGTHQITA
jgi:hypothetical protein